MTLVALHRRGAPMGRCGTQEARQRARHGRRTKAVGRHGSGLSVARVARGGKLAGAGGSNVGRG
jgi:hypothetical protein